MNYLQAERLERLAREYALGTLAGRARRRFERVLRDSHEARVAVGQWQERLATLAAEAPGLQPQPAVWRGIEARLFEPRPAGGASRAGWLAALLSRRSLGGALAGALLAVLVLRLQPGWIGTEPVREALPASYVGLLSDAQGRAAVLASSRRHGRVLTVKLLQPMAVPAGSVAQLWAHPKEGAPFPVGTVPPSGSATIALADTSERLFANVPRLAVTIEPGPAAPGSVPSGEPVASGPCVKLW
jgi:anti-sigma-K factor RskA